MFITLEGIEGSGKTTISALVGQYLESRGLEILRTREPGGSALGRRLRPILLDARNSGLSFMAEFYLFLADRAQHLAEVIRPALESGQVVVCDRFSDSTIAYQGYGRGMDLETLLQANRLACKGLEPDVTLLLDLPAEIGLERAGKRNREQKTTVSEGRFDSESLKFHQRVREGYLALARDNPGRIVVIDASGTVKEVENQCIAALRKLGMA